MNHNDFIPGVMFAAGILFAALGLGMTLLVRFDRSVDWWSFAKGTVAVPVIAALLIAVVGVMVWLFD